MKALVSIRRSIVTLVAVMTLGVAVNAQAAGDGVPLDNFPVHKLTELPSLQDGAKTFVNYCLNCHGAAAMRYNRLGDIGLSTAQITDNLMFTGKKVGDPMTITMRPDDAKEWFGALPPDLSVITRARSSGAGSGSDWLYTYLRSYYRDSTRPTGWNNTVFDSVGMPHVFWELQGARGAIIEDIKAVRDPKTGLQTGFARTVVTFDNDGSREEKTEKLEGGSHHEGSHLTLTAAKGGTLSQADYDEKVANLVGYMTYVSDPSAQTRGRLGVWVMLFLGVLVCVTWWLNREYWKDIK